VIDVPTMPHFTGHQDSADTPACGTSIPSLGIPCAEPAAWHLLWGAASAGSVKATLVCQVHMEQEAALHAWFARHVAATACSSPDPTWQPAGCTPADGEAPHG
jgi:hypothetical protein